MKYLTILRKTTYGYDVHVPALPGCHSQGDTEREALANIKDATRIYREMRLTDLAYPRRMESWMAALQKKRLSVSVGGTKYTQSGVAPLFL